MIVLADEQLVISGNAQDSNNSINIQSSNGSSTQQSNTATVNTDVHIDSNTGYNDASNNAGGQNTITTGDVNTTTSIDTVANISSATIECCKESINNTISVSGNAQGSVNTANATNTNNTVINVNQIATISNISNIQANTGYNSASGNQGDSTIKTGDISNKEYINNGVINSSYIKAPAFSGQVYLIKIVNNAQDSTNNVFADFIYDLSLNVNNVATIVNDTHADLNTGHNSADNNDGDVSIKTGDVYNKIKVTNDANHSIAQVSCCEKHETTPPTPPTPTPPTGGDSPKGGNGNSGNGGSSNSNNTTTSIGNDILPSTGTNWTLILMIANIGMFLMGLYLRIRSGRSPTLAYTR